MADSQGRNPKRASAKNAGPRARRAAASEGGEGEKPKPGPVRQKCFPFFYSLELSCPQTGAADT